MPSVDSDFNKMPFKTANYYKMSTTTFKLAFF